MSPVSFTAYAKFSDPPSVGTLTMPDAGVQENAA